jgi:2-keto-3-deoxy-L-rhamnonate aldolase RhmA
LGARPSVTNKKDEETPKMHDREPCKRKLQSGEAAAGCWLWLFSPMAAEIVAQAGYDCIMIDLEHGAGSIMDSVALMQAVAASGCAPLMRVPANDPVWVKRALDAGVEGVMIPAVSTAEEAIAAVRACRYPPEGERGMAVSVVRAADYGSDWRNYLKRINGDLLVICQIETREGVDNVDAIAGVDGVDMLFIGPFDLSASLGYPGEPDHVEVRKAILRIEQAAARAGKLLGSIQTSERPAARLFADGYKLVLADGDVTLLRDAARNSVSELQKAKH